MVGVEKGTKNSGPMSEEFGAGPETPKWNPGCIGKSNVQLLSTVSERLERHLSPHWGKFSKVHMRNLYFPGEETEDTGVGKQYTKAIL